MKIRQNKMLGYLAVTAGVGCAASTANAAVVFYGNASNNNLQADPAGIALGLRSDLYAGNYRTIDVNLSAASFVARAATTIFTNCADLTDIVEGALGGTYFSVGNMAYGASLGSHNYANISFNGNDGIYEAVAQFYFDGMGGGYLIAIATTNPIPNPQDLSAVGGPSLSISAGKAMIDAAAAVPEPSGLALLALGATGLVARRQRRKAA